MDKTTLRQRASYFFDNLMSRGTSALIGMLAIISLVLVSIAALVLSLTGFHEEGRDSLTFGEATWESLVRTLDPGVMGQDTGSGFRFVMLLVTIGGVFVVSSLIGVLNSGLTTQMDRLRKGRSLVLENNHTLILGWSPQVFTIVSELMIANENQRNARIVILADRDKIKMDGELRERVKTIGSTRVICRSGNPIDMNDLEIASPHTARSIIILPAESDDPDSFVVKTVLALTNNPRRHKEPYHIVTEIRDEKNMDVIKMVSANDHVQAVLTGDLIARVVAQTSRQSGLSVVYTELMDFGGDEIYFTQEPTIYGMTYGEVLLGFEDSTAMGVQKSDGTILMNPSMDSRIEPGDRIFALSEDDDTIKLSGISGVPIEENLVRTNGTLPKPVSEKALVFGWNRCAGMIIQELDAYVTKGSSVTVVAESEGIEDKIKACTRKLINQEVELIKGDTTNRELLDELKIANYNHVIVLAYEDLGVQEADAKTLVTLLHLRDIAEKNNTPFSIISEMLDLHNRELAEVTQVDDFIVSEHMVSLMMTQLSENADLFAVFEDIFDAEGSEIYLKPIGKYVETEQPVNFYTVTEAARRRGETAIGYRLMSEAGKAPNYGVYTNPKKSNKIIFAPEDKIIVIAED